MIVVLDRSSVPPAALAGVEELRRAKTAGYRRQIRALEHALAARPTDPDLLESLDRARRGCCGWQQMSLTRRRFFAVALNPT